MKFNEQEEKTKNFGNLSQLTGIDKYKKIQVTHDYTPSERDMINEFCSEARQKNTKEKETDKIHLGGKKGPKEWTNPSKRNQYLHHVY